MGIDDRIEENILPLTEERMFYILNSLKKNFQNQISDFLSDFIRPSFYSPHFRYQAKMWKDFLIRQGIINEKEEIIYNQQ